ncbi:winged helix-turn-helix domain-containing protein [Psychrobium sp. nBUS_13]|uniref:winged helix-turn-helix domain-containing protein n=1 Tax=Psychrobium sp. nBUS_13 TaxID=3395319 RepID=UPI003EBCB95B
MMAPQWINDNKVDWQRGEVTVATQIKSVEPKAMAVLRVLVEAKGDVVTQQEILSRVWGGVVVAPNALQRCIAQLRKVFNDDAKTQSVIKTHPKLGYSLVAHVSLSASERVVTNRSFKLYSLLFFSAVALASGLLWPPSDKGLSSLPISVQQVSMITSDDAPQFGGVVVDDNIIFIEGDLPQHQRIVSKHLNDGQTVILSDNLWLNGELAVSFERDALYVSRLSITDDIKCSEIAKLSLYLGEDKASVIKSSALKTVIPCVQGFYHQPQSFGQDKLLTLHRYGDGINSLQLHDLLNGMITNINHQLGDLVKLAVARDTKQLAILSHQQGKFQVSLVLLANNSLEVLQQWNVEDAVADSAIRWLSVNEFAIAATQSLKFFRVDGSAHSLMMPSRDALFAVLHYDDRFIVELGREDWDVHQAQLDGDSSNAKYENIARSIYADSSGSFRPQHPSVSVLSSRSGNKQIWLKKETTNLQLTGSQYDVSSYVWSGDGLAIIYVSHGQLWIQKIGESARKLAASFEVHSIYQWFIDNQNAKTLLDVVINGHRALVEYDLVLEEVTSTINIETQWAQRTSYDQYVISSQGGYLKKLHVNNNEIDVSDIEQTQSMKLQWRFFYRADHSLYFQDKQQNIWRLSMADLGLEKVGHYDENTLLMTDIDPQQSRYLSDAFKRKVRDFAFIN